MISLKYLTSALQSAEPAQALRQAVLELSREGHEKDSIYKALETLLDYVRSQEGTSASSEDVVLDLMDSLAGWCHPDAELLPERKPS
jgi:hypothetical protein